MRKILILGSCVSRDALEFSKAGEFELAAYFARTSLAALGGTPAPIPEVLQKLPSGWRQRLVLADHDKSTLLKLTKTPFDLLLIDLIDERFNLLQLPNGSIITLSVEYMSIAARPLPGRVIKSCSTEHINLWRQGLQRLVATLKKYEKEDLVRVSRIFLAESTTNGESINGFDIEKTHTINDFLKNRYKDIEQVLGAEIFYNYDEAMFKADKDHKWGSSPFHFIETLYKTTVDYLRNDKPK